MEEPKDEEKKYNLYTEHIMPEKGKKIKRFLKKAASVIAMAVVFGLVAGLVMIIVYRTGARFLKSEDKQEITLDNSYTTQPDTTESETEQETGETVTISPEKPEPQETDAPEKPSEGETVAEIGQLTVYADALKSAADGINKSSAAIAITAPSASWVEQTERDYGIIVSNDTSGYYILTKYSIIMGADSISAEFSDGVMAEAVMVAGDAVSDMAVIKASRDISGDILPVKLGNSDEVQQGDLLIAVGNLYGLGSAFGWGIATGTNGILYDTDSWYKIINTDISCTSSGYGFICNLDGEVVAVAFGSQGESANGTISGYAVSSVRAVVEDLINGRQKPYFGIKGQNATQSIEDNLGIPKGVYIAAVEVNSPAYAAGIQTGDIITGMGSVKIEDMEQFMKQLSASSSGDTVTVTVKRKSRDSYKEIVFRVVLGVE